MGGRDSLSASSFALLSHMRLSIVRRLRRPLGTMGGRENGSLLRHRLLEGREELGMMNGEWGMIYILPSGFLGWNRRSRWTRRFAFLDALLSRCFTIFE